MKAFPQENAAWAWATSSSSSPPTAGGAVSKPLEAEGRRVEGTAPGLWEQRALGCRSSEPFGVLTCCQVAGPSTFASTAVTAVDGCLHCSDFWVLVAGGVNVSHFRIVILCHFFLPIFNFLN